MKFIKQTFIPHTNNNFRPHLIRRHGLVFAILLLLGIQTISGLQTNATGQVLGYATDVTVSGLLSATNAQRVAAGKSALTLSSKLNAAAQGKANHMISHNYWAHTAPDGTTPWYWFDWSGYNYLVAGENLAYGFGTSGGVVNGWMNSPSHRDNMLNGAFDEVGFGIANGANYQGGQNTVVVAHYGDPVTVSKPNPPTPPAPTSQAPPTKPTSVAASSQPTPSTADKPKEEAADKAETAEEPKPEETAATNAGELDIRGIAPTEAKRTSNLEALLEGQAGWALYATALIALSLGFIYAYRHVLFIHRVVIRGEDFIVSHPLLEASIIYVLIWLLLAGSFGNVL